MAERPVEILASAYSGDENPSPWDKDNAEVALAALHAAGWRLVRTDAACGTADAEHDYGDPHRCIGECIVDEWTPVAASTDPARETT